MSHPDNPWLGAAGGAALAFTIAVGYVLGCCNAAYYALKWRTGKDIRDLGTGTAGATNAGRVLGRKGFAAVFLFDLAKGVAAVGIARALGVGPGGVGLVALAATVGHIWPVQLGFAGGKGVATALGALLAYDYRIVGVLVGAFVAFYSIWRRFSLSGLLAFATCPLALFGLGWPPLSVLCMSALTAVVWVAHRENLARQLRDASLGSRAGNGDTDVSTNRMP